MKKEKYSQALMIMMIGIVILVSLSGCTSNQNTNGNNLSGTWVGSVGMSMFGGQNNSSVSQIMFTDDKAEITSKSDRGTFTMEYTYSVNGDVLVFEPKFTNRNGFPGGQSNNGSLPPNGTGPWNGSRPPSNGTWAPNGTRPDNSTWPSNRTRPNNGTWNPGNGRPSMSVSFTYSFNEEYTILYLNGATFKKVQ